MKRGYIKIFRKFFEDHEFWKEKRKFSKAEAWMDILKSARWKDEPETLVDSRGAYTLELGDFYISERFLCERWMWSRTKVRAFLNYLIERESILYKKKTTHRTIITVTNLKSYLGWEFGKKTSDQTSEVPVKDQGSTSEVPKKKKVKKEKQDKKVKNIYGEYKKVRLTKEQHTKLIEDFGELKVNDFIQRLDEYLENNPKKSYANHSLTIRNWEKKDKENNGQENGRQSDIGGVRPTPGKYDHLG